LEHHHLVPRSLGGTDDESNLITLCSTFHGKWHSMARQDNISCLTTAALAAAKARGVRLGNPRLVAGTAVTARVARAGLKAKTLKFAVDLEETIRERQKVGATTPTALAASLNDADVLTRRGCQWTSKAVSRVLAILDTPECSYSGWN
jgi:hypothetical protein